jgi:hypothetical protein
MNKCASLRLTDPGGSAACAGHDDCDQQEEVIQPDRDTRCERAEAPSSPTLGEVAEPGGRGVGVLTEPFDAGSGGEEDGPDYGKGNPAGECVE